MRGADTNIDPTATVGYRGNVPAATLTGLGAPQAMAFDANGNLFVANSYGPNGYGTTVSEFAPGSLTPSTTLTGLNKPDAIVFDASGNLYVANGNGDTVSVFAPGSTTPTGSLTGVYDPVGLAVDQRGDVLVGNSPTFNFTPGWISLFTPGSTVPTMLNDSSTFKSAAFDSRGFLYGAGGNNWVDKYSPITFSHAAHIVANMSYLSAGVAFDSVGNLYVGDGASNTVVEFPPNSSASSTIYTGLSNPSDVAIDASGNLYVSYFTSGPVYRFTPGNTTPSAILYAPGSVGSYQMTFDSSGHLYVGTINGTVNEYDFNTPMTTQLNIRSSLPSRPMSIGGNNNPAVPGINLSSAELARIFTASNGSIVFGDSSQAGTISFHTATPATTTGAATIVLQSPSGPGGIILDDGGGSGTR